MNWCFTYNVVSDYIFVSRTILQQFAWLRKVLKLSQGAGKQLVNEEDLIFLQLLKLKELSSQIIFFCTIKISGMSDFINFIDAILRKNCTPGLFPLKIPLLLNVFLT